MTHENIDLNVAEDMEIAAIIRERIAAGEATPMDDLLRQYGVPVDLSHASDTTDLNPFKTFEG